MDDEKLYKQARARVENKIRNASDKDIIMDQEKEIMYYRRTIEHLKEKQNTFKEDNELPKQYENVDEIRIKNEDYIIKYNKDTDMFSLSVHFIKLVNDEETIRLAKMNEFDITNITRQKLYEQKHNLNIM